MADDSPRSSGRHSGNPLPRLDRGLSELYPPDESPSSTRAEGPRVSYELTKSFVYSTVAGTPQEQDKIAKAKENLEFDGDVRIISHVEGTKEVLCISYTETFDALAAGLSDGSIRLFKVNTGECSATLRDNELQKDRGPTTCIKHRPVNKNHPVSQTLTASYSNGLVKCWHYPTGQCVYTIREKRQTLGLSYHPRLPKFVTVGDDAKLYLYDEETKAQERIFQSSEQPETLDGHRSRVFAAAFNPQSAHEIISGGWDNTVFFWDTRQPHALRHISDVHICGDSIDISKSGKEIITCAWQKKDSIQLWDYSSGKLIVTLKPDIYDSKLYTGKFINTLFVACGGTDQNILRIVDLRSHMTVAAVRNLAYGVYNISVGPVSSRKQRRAKSADPSSLMPKIAFCSGKSILEIDDSWG